MIRVQSNAAEVSSALADLGKKYPDAVRRGLIDFAMGVKKHGADVVRTGSSATLGVSLGFAPFQSLTRALYMRRGKPTGVFGGKLAASIRSYSQGHDAFVGFPVGLVPFSDAFQTPENREFTAKERRWFYVRGINPAKPLGSLMLTGKKKMESARGVRYERKQRSLWQPVAASTGVQSYLFAKVTEKVKRLFKQAVRRDAKAAIR